MSSLPSFDARVRRSPMRQAARAASPASRARVARRTQRGAIALLAAICVSVTIVALGVVDVGHFYYARRDLQRTADLAAAAGVQMIGSAGGCGAATASAQLNASANGLPADGVVTPTCGRWDPSTNAAPSFFNAVGTPLNALQVVVRRPVSFMFLAGQPLPLTATATAHATNIRAFSLSTSLASLSGGLVNGLLNGLLNSNLNLDIASYQGLATAQIKLMDLATALNAGSIAQLLNTQVTVGQLANAMVTALSKGNVVSASVTSALGTIAGASTGAAKISLGNTASTSGVLALGLGDPQAAANATVNVLDMLMVAAEIAHGQSAINLGTALNLAPLATVTAQAKIIQPPVIAVGEAGQNPDGSWRTSAHAAQVRVYLNIALLSLNIGIAQVNALNLPISIEAGQSTANLVQTVCTTSKAASTSVISAQPGIAAICVGNDAASNLTNLTTPTVCNQPVHLTSATVLGLSLIDVYVGNLTTKKGLLLPLQPPSATSMTFNGVSGDADDYQSANSNQVGGATGGLLAAVVTNLLPSLYLTVGGVSPSPAVAATLQFLLSGIGALLSPILSSLDLLLVPLLQLLGVQIGVSTVHDLGLACGQAQLVY